MNYELSVMATDDDPIVVLEHEMGTKLPSSYRSFLAENPHGWMGDRAVLHSVSEVAEANRLLEIARYAPGFLAVGTDGGDGVIVVRLDDDTAMPLIVDAGSMQPERMKPLDKDWQAWYAAGCPIPDPPAKPLVRVVVQWPDAAPTIREIAALRQLIPALSVRPLGELRRELGGVGPHVVARLLPHLALRLQAKAEPLGLRLQIRSDE